MSRKIGDRVGAILSVKGDTVEFYGYGVYAGEEVPHGAAGWMAEAAIEADLKNPKIDLDLGGTVFGCECWWGSEEKVLTILEGKKVVMVNIAEHRKTVEAQDEGE